MAIIALVVFQISLGEIIRIRQVSSRFRNVKKEDIETFRKIDTNNDGALSKSELEAVLGFSRVDIHSLFSLADLNSDGQINFIEFCLPVTSQLQEEAELEVLDLTNPWKRRREANENQELFIK